MERELISKEQITNEGYTLNEIARIIRKNLDALEEEERILKDKLKDLQEAERIMDEGTRRG